MLPVGVNGVALLTEVLSIALLIPIQILGNCHWSQATDLVKLGAFICI